MNPEVQPTPSEEESDFHSSADVRRAIDRLQDADYVRLMLIASSFARRRIRGTSVEPEDLLQEAITKTLDGTRGWSRGVSIIKHLDRVMESDSGHIAEQRSARPEQPLPETDDDEPA